MRHAVGGKESPLFHLVGGRKATAVHPEARGCECTPACGLPPMVLCRTNLWVGRPWSCSPKCLPESCPSLKAKAERHTERGLGLAIRAAGTKFSMT